MRWLIALLLVFCSCVEGATLHSLLVGKPMSASMGVRLANTLDLKRASTELNRLAEFGGYAYSETSICDEHTSAERVVEAIDKMQVGKDDIVIFYYTGHGKSGQTEWPQLFFDYGQKVLNTEDVAKLLHAKGPQCALVLVDCSNRQCPLTCEALEIDGAAMELTEMDGSSIGLAELKGLVLASGASRGEESFVGANGSLFTSALAASLRQELVMENPQWGRLFKRADQLTGDRQRPQWRFYEWKQN